MTVNGSGTKNNSIRIRPCISNKELDDDLLDFLVIATVCETYALHTEARIVAGTGRDEILRSCGQIKKLNRECSPPPNLVIGALSEEEAVTNRDRKITRLTVIKNNLPVPNIFDTDLNCEADTFFEVLMLNLKNEVVSHQVFMRHVKFEKIESLKKC
jgi:hypothetical protein